MKRISKSFSILIALASGLCAAGSISGSALAETVVHYSSSFEPPFLDPVASPITVTAGHGHLVYDTLFSEACDGSIKPQMVQDYSVKSDSSGAVWTMTLRNGLKFHDGSPVTSADVIASIKRWAGRDQVGRKLNQIGMELAAVDAKTFTIKMPVETPLLLNALGKGMAPVLFIMRASDAALPMTEPVKEIVGSGPFKFVPSKYVKGHKMVYERNADYVPRSEPVDCLAGGKVVKIDRVEWDILPDAATAVLALQNGEIDIYEATPLDLVPLLKADPNIVVQNYKNLGKMGMIRFNFLKPPFDKPEARLGLMKLMNQSDAMAVVAGSDPNQWKECYSFLGCGGTNEFPSTKVNYDVQEGLRLLKKAGYNGEPIVMLTVKDDDAIFKIGTYAAEQMRAAGLKVDMQLMDFGTLYQRRSDKTAWSVFPMWMPGNELNNPFTNLALADGCDQVSGYAGWACSADLNKARDQYAVEPDPKRAAERMHEVGEAAQKLMPIIPLGLFQHPMSYRTRLKGVVQATMPVFWNMEVSGK